MSLADLSASTSLHPNTVRAHLIALEDQAVIQKSRALPTGRGRPAWLYSLVPHDTDPGVREYAGLAAALATALRRHSAHPAQAALAAGRAWGSDLAQRAPDKGQPPHRAAVDLLAELRFAPESGRAQHTVRLTACPLLAAAEQYPDVVCSIHRGLVEGALEQWGDASTAVQLTPFAEPGACVLTLTPVGSEQGT